MSLDFKKKGIGDEEKQVYDSKRFFGRRQDNDHDRADGLYQ
jgi:hypothetical protein